MAKRKTKRPPKKPARKPARKVAKKTPRGGGAKKATAAQRKLPPVMIAVGLHQSCVNFLGTQVINNISPLWDAFRQCKSNGNEVEVPGLVMVELVRYLNETQPVVQLFIRLQQHTSTLLQATPASEKATKATKARGKTSGKAS